MNENLGSNADDFFKNLLGQAWKTHRGIEKIKKENRLKKWGETKTPEDETAKRILTLMILGIIGLFGAEPAKVIWRKNLGFGSVSTPRLTLICILFFLFGLVSLVVSILILLAPENASSASPDGAFSFLVTGIFYICLAVYIILRNSKENLAKNKVQYGYQGDSRIESYFSGAGPKTIKWFIEPVLTISIGILFTLFINIFGGIPIIICGLSMWGYTIMEQLFFGNHSRDTILRRNLENNPDSSFNEVES